MFQAVSANAILVWFLWGFFMGLGWVIATWLFDRLMSRWK